MSVVEEIIRAHANIAQSDANEAETRLKVIDRVLFEVLEWTHDDVSVEERTPEDGNTKFVDYIVRTAGSSFVIEAKKVGAEFDNLAAGQVGRRSEAEDEGPRRPRSNLSGRTIPASALAELELVDPAAVR